MGHNTCKSMGRVLCGVRRHHEWLKWPKYLSGSVLKMLSHDK